MSARDRLAVLIIGAGVLLFGMWFVLVSPERQQAAKAAVALSQAQSQRDLAVSNEHAAEQAQMKFGANVGALGQLNKAVPANQDVAGLLAELEAAAQAQGVGFVSITNGAGGSSSGSGTSAPPSAPAPTPSVGPTGSATSAVNKANASSASTASANPGGSPSPAGSAGAASGPATPSSFPAQSYNITLSGDYPHLQGFLNTLNHWTSVNGGQVSVSGPLLSIQSVKVTTQANSGPAATVVVSAYTSPQGALSPTQLLAQLQPSATAPIGKPAAPAAAGHAPAPPTAAVGAPR